MKIDVNRPCSEPWEEMNPCKDGRFCLVCNKTVFDLNENSKVRFLMRLAANPTDPVCIKIQNKINWEESDISRVLPLLKKRVNAPIALAAWIILSGLILSCEENKKEIEQNAPVAKTEKVVTKKAIKKAPEKAPVIERIMYEPPIIDPPPIIVGGYDPQPPPEPITLGELTYVDTLKESPLTFAEIMPSYPGEINDMIKFIYDNLVIPEELKEISWSGKVFVRFVVEKDGSLSSFEILKGTNPSANQSAINVCKKMPKWKPGSQNGKKVAVYVTIPINIDLR